METIARTYTAEQKEFLQLLQNAVDAAKQLQAAMSAISHELAQKHLLAA